MHHPTDRIAHTTAIAAPVVEHWHEFFFAISFMSGINWLVQDIVSGTPKIFISRLDNHNFFLESVVKWSIFFPPCSVVMLLKGKKRCGFRQSWNLHFNYAVTNININVLKVFIQCSSNTTRMFEGNALFNNAFNTFLLWSHDIRHMLKDHWDSKRGNLHPSPNGYSFWSILFNSIRFFNVHIQSKLL